METESEEPEGLDLIGRLVEQGQEPEITGRQLLSWFGARRRGSRVVARVRAELFARRLVTEPDFDSVWVDVPLRVKRLATASPADESPPADAKQESGAAPSNEPPQGGGAAQAAEPPPEQKGNDPILRIGKLPAANKPVVSVPPNSSLEEATTIMMLNDFSQLPVIQGERNCKGAISWQSIGAAKAMGRDCKTVNDCMVPAEEVSWSTGLLQAIPKIVAAGFVLVKSPDNRYQGIVTVADLSIQFRALSEKFLLLEQIEMSLRMLIGRCFDIDEIRSAKNESDAGRVINSVDDLSFGEYVRLIEPTERWPKLGLRCARGPFLKRLVEVNEIRNDVMHFDPGLDDEDMVPLRTFASFLEQVVR